MSSYADFKSKVINRAYDIDGYYGAQCWDGYAQYCKYLGVPYASCSATGYVKDIWTQRASNGVLNYFDEVSVLQPGDVQVFKEVAGWTPLSHIAIFDSDIDGVYGWFLGQNQGGSNGAFNLVKLPYSATYATGFRPKAFTTTNTTTSSTIWDFNAVIKKGDTVKTGSLSISKLSASLTEAWIPDLDAWIPLSGVTEASDTGDGACDNYLATTAAKVYLDPVVVEDVNASTNRVKVHGVWVKAGPLAAKR
jgi:hypothetical protein